MLNHLSNTITRTTILSLYIAISSIPASWAATFNVNSPTDATDATPGNGVCETATGNTVYSLRAAIQESNALAGADTINLPAGNYINGTSGAITITSDLTINGATTTTTIIDGNATDRVMIIAGGSRTVNINSLTIQNGNIPAGIVGAGISAWNNDNITLTDVIVQNNHSYDGGGIYNQGNLTLIRTTVTGNTALHTSNTSSDFVRGGGIYQSSGTLIIRDSTISNNTAVAAGGIFNMGTAYIESSTIVGNLATNDGDTTNIINDGDAGGGIVNNTEARMYITNSTISGNRANGNYGGIHNWNGQITLSNVTVTGNISDYDADGFGNGGGIGTSNIIYIQNTIVAGNTANGGAAKDCSRYGAGSISSLGYNLIGNNTSCAFFSRTGDIVGTSASPIEPRLTILSNNGGLTATHLLLSDSPAIDGGNPTGCNDQNGTTLTLDQRGAPRVAIGNSQTLRCDIGAVEYNGPVASAGTDQIVNFASTVTLNGGNSSAPAGIATYAWTQLTGTTVTLQNSNTASASFTAPANAGVREFQLTITDNNGASASDRMVVTVNAPPVANAGPDQTVAASTTINLTGAGSSDSDGTVTSYSWTQTGGTTVTLNGTNTATPNFTAPTTAGALTFLLTVTDNNNAQNTDTVIITINAPPTANAGTDQTVTTGVNVNLNGSNSSDSDGTISTYAWAQASGTAVTLSANNTTTPSFTAPATAGTLTFELTVTDNNGAQSTDTVAITVNSVTTPPPPASGGGGGCTLNPTAAFDPTFPLLLGLATFVLWRRRLT